MQYDSDDPQPCGSKDKLSGSAVDCGDGGGKEVGLPGVFGGWKRKFYGSP